MINLASFLIRIGLAMSFLYAATAALLDPSSWIGFLPAWIKMLVPAEVALFTFSIFQSLLALWLLSGWRTFIAAIISAGFIFLIIVQNLGALDIIFRDLAILCSTIALALLARSSNKQ